jgi:uncharacterized protein with GYD domain
MCPLCVRGWSHVGDVSVALPDRAAARGLREGGPERARYSPAPRSTTGVIRSLTSGATFDPLTATRANERDGAALPVEVQLYAGDLGQADRKPRGPPRRRSVVHRVAGWEAPRVLYAFGAHDGYTLWEAPDNVSMAAVALAISGGGALSSLETTVLLTVDETMDALRKAEQVQYQPPGA